jgi:hypothetical protein
MADTYDPNMHSVPQPEAAETPDEGRPNLDSALPPPPPAADIVDALIGDPVVPGGRAFIRIVSVDGQTDVPDPGA